MRQHNIWCVYVAFCVERYVKINILDYYIIVYRSALVGM